MKVINYSNKSHCHIISSIGGSIWEITSDLLPFLEKEFIITKEWWGETPLKKEILLCHFLKPEIFLEPDVFDSFKTKILIQPIDGTSMKKEVVDMINCFDLVITPAHAGKNIMLQNGVGVPIKVIPNYYKPNLFEKKIWSSIERYIPNDKIIFYHESTFFSRKGIEILYEGFIKAFADTPYANKVILIVKDLPYNIETFNKNEELKKQAITLQNSYTVSPDILKFSTFLNDDELKALWNRTDIYVSMAKLEGFGIPLLRMLLLNKPIICLKNENSGYHDFLTEDTTYFIDTLQTVAKEEFMWLYNYENKWEITNINYVI